MKEESEVLSKYRFYKVIKRANRYKVTEMETLSLPLGRYLALVVDTRS